VASVPFITLSLVSGLGRSADLWLVSATVASAVAVGWYASATVLAEVPVFIFDGLSRVLFPSIARSLSEDDKALSSRYAVQSVRLGIMVTVLVAGLVVGCGRQILQFIYSAQFLGAYLPFAILTIASIGRVIQSVCTQILMAQDRRVLANTILVVTLAIQLVLLAVASVRYGAVGAATAATAAALLAGAWSALAIRDLLGAKPLATLARCAAAAAVVAVAIYNVPFAPVYVLIALPVGAAVYLGLITVFGEIGREDYAAVRAAIGR
jgi:O-antigen/teichoic acid export membrane protein